MTAKGLKLNLSEYPDNFSRIGQGCMGLGGEFSRNESRDLEDVLALRQGIDLGLTFLDTAEIYGGGHSEELVGQAAKGQRDKVFIATKFSPENSSYEDVLSSAEKSLERLGTSYIDLYQAHWPNPKIPIHETVKALEKLVLDGKVRFIGLSNFSKNEMRLAIEALKNESLFSNQVEYNLFDRSVDYDVGPYCEQTGVRVIAYSPLDKARLAVGTNGKLLEFLAQKYEKTESQITLNWHVNRRKTTPIPKSINPQHIKSNSESLEFTIEEADLDQIDSMFPSSPKFVDPRRIKVSIKGEGARKVYQTIDEALENHLEHTPSPSELSEFIKSGDVIKPVRLIPTSNDGGDYDYFLVEGRIRYWAWVIAYDWEQPIPAYVRH